MNPISFVESLPYFGIILEMVIAIIISLVIYKIISGVISKISSIKTRYNLRKFFGLMIGMIDLIIFLSLFVKDTSILLVSAGLFSAGIAFSLRDPITSLIAWVVIIFFKPFTIGERIKVGNEEGDVIDINAFFFTIMEIKQWTAADLYTGRVVEIPNNQIMTIEVINFSKGFNFLWDNIDIPLFYDVDIEEVTSVLKEIAISVTSRFFEEAGKQYEKMKTKYYIERGIIEPQVFVSFNSNYVLVNLRYITDLWDRKKTETAISKLILSEFKKRNIGIASSSVIVTTKNS
jgi:small-conductance mechanosensitive channel